MILEAILKICGHNNSEQQMAVSHFKSHKLTLVRRTTASFFELQVILIFAWSEPLLHTRRVNVSVPMGIKKQAGDRTGRLHLLDDAFLRLQHEVAVVHPCVGEVNEERGERPEGLWVFSLQLLGHVEAVHHLALPSFHSLVDAVQKLHLPQPTTHTCSTNAPFTTLTAHKQNASS